MMCIRLALILIFWTRVISRPLGCVGGVMVEAEPDVVSCGLGVVVIVTSLVQASAIKQFIRFKRSRTIMNLFAVAIWISRDKILTLIFQNTVFNLLLSVEFGKNYQNPMKWIQIYEFMIATIICSIPNALQKLPVLGKSFTLSTAIVPLSALFVTPFSKIWNIKKKLVVRI